MPTLLVLYPAYGTVSCHEVCRRAESMDGVRMILADDIPTTSDLDIFDEVWELPPPERLVESYDMLRRWCDKRPPDGIFLQSERGLLLGSLIARDFGLKGPSVEAAHFCSNKYLQRVAISRAGAGNPEFVLAGTADEVRRFARQFGFPVVLKCVISTMSRLVTLVNREDDIDAAVAHVRQGIVGSADVARLIGFANAGRVDLGCDPAGQFLVESFLTGDMVETDGLVIGNTPFTFGVTEQVQSVDPPFFIEGYLYPAECSGRSPIEAASDRVIASLGLTDSAFSIELRVSNGAVSIIEVNGRLGWDDGFSDLFAVRTGRDRISQAMEMAVGIKPTMKLDESRFAALAYRSYYGNGVIDELPTRAALADLETPEIKLGLSTHRGARFNAPPSPECYPHVLWALATHSTSSRAAYEMARRVVHGLDVLVRPV